ncbi:hypothetical protein Tco_1431383 [Tanacetum coccineum]
MCDKKNSVLFTDTECVVLSPDFKLTDESHVLLKASRKENVYSVDLKNVVPQGGRKPVLSFMRPFGCPVTILNTIDHLGNQSNGSASTKTYDDAGGNSSNDQEKDDNINSTNNINTASDGNNTNNVNVVSLIVNAASIEVKAVDPKTSIKLPNDPNMHELEDIVYSDDDEDVGAEADMNNLDAFMLVSPIPTTRIHKDHPVDQIIRDLNSTPQTRRMKKNLKEHGLFSSVQQRTNHKDFQNCLFACFLSQEEPVRSHSR